MQGFRDRLIVHSKSMIQDSPTRNRESGGSDCGGAVSLANRIDMDDQWHFLKVGHHFRAASPLSGADRLEATRIGFDGRRPIGR